MNHPHPARVLARKIIRRWERIYYAAVTAGQRPHLQTGLEPSADTIVNRWKQRRVRWYESVKKAK